MASGVAHEYDDGLTSLTVAPLRDGAHRLPACRARTIQFMQKDIASPDQAIEKLKQDWDQLSDPDRALAIQKIKTSGLSNRKIASGLGRAESSIRRLLLLLHASAVDLAAARNGSISTSELARRAITALQRQAASQQANARQERARQAIDGAKLICRWLRQTQFHGPSCEMIINEVRRELAMRQSDRTLPAPPTTLNLPVVEIIRRSKPAELTDDGIDIIAWYAQWLCRWTFFAFPDPDIRDNALDTALEQKWKW